MLGAGAPNERGRKRDIFKSYFHVVNIVNEPFDAKEKK